MRIKLSEQTTKTIRFLSDVITLSTASTHNITVTLTRTGTFSDPRYGRFSITPTMLQSFVKNFNDNVYGQDIVIDVAHKPQEGAAAYAKKLLIDGDKLKAQIELTDYGISAIKKRGYKYLSAEYLENFIDNEHENEHGPTLLGAGLTTRPCIKNLDKIQLSESSLSDCPTLLNHDLFSGDINMWKELIKKLTEQLQSLSLQDDTAKSLIQLAESQLPTTEDEKAAQAIIDQVLNAAKTLSEKKPDSPTTIQLNGIDSNSVKKLVAEELQRQKEEAKKLTEDLDAKRKVLSDTISKSEGISDDTKKQLTEQLSPLVNASMDDDQIKQLAEYQVKQAEELEAAKKLQTMGMPVNTPTGVVQLMDTPATEAKKLEQIQHEKLKSSHAFRNKQIKLSETISPFVEDVLAVFDYQHAAKINQAVKQLNEGAVNISNTDLPIGFQREVIREALSDLNILSLVATFTDATATATTQIPYEVRNVGHVINQARSYERHGIQKVGVSQHMDLAYINAMKLAIDVSNEVMHFTKTSGINWDAWGRSLATVSRLLRELLHIRIANEIQRVSDSYAALDVIDEVVNLQLDGTRISITTVECPIVQQHQIYDLQGNKIGATENPITVKRNGIEINSFNGSGKQAAGTYYQILNYNLGYFQFVDELGVPVALDNTQVTSISYSYATNIIKVNADVPNGVDPDVHLNKLIRAVGTRKAMMNTQRFIKPDFLLMSDTLNDVCTNAEQFIRDRKRDGSDTTSSGDLAAVKSISTYGTNAPGINLGDERIQMGIRNILSYTVAKAWSMIPPEQARDEDGQLIGAMESYGEEYNAIHVPKPIRNHFTAVLYYSFANRNSGLVSV